MKGRHGVPRFRMLALEIAFWILIGSSVYSMLVYPALMLALSSVFRRSLERKPIRPSVSLIISAFNEEAVIARKLENSLELNYESDRLEIIVASDGSTDRTDEIVRQYADRGIQLLRFAGGMGKTAVLNEAMNHVRGEVVVFSDATGMYREDALTALVAHFADPRVGCVSGRVAYEDEGGLASQGFTVYQWYVLALRRAESAFGNGFNASGSIHAIRRSAFRPGPVDTFMDMVDPLHVAMEGLYTTFEENAISMEEVRVRTADEFRARLRIGLRAWSFLAYALPRLPICRSPMYCFQVVSHKFLRWTIAPSLGLILVLNLLLSSSSPFYTWLLLGQVLYYLLTLAAFVLGRFDAPVPVLSALVFFNSTCLVYLIALVRFISGQRVRQWVPGR